MNSPDSHLELLLEEIRQAANSEPQDTKSGRSRHKRGLKKPIIDPLWDELLNRLND